MSSNIKPRRLTVGAFIAFLFLSGGCFPLWAQTPAPPSANESSPAQTTSKETRSTATEPKSDQPSVTKAAPTSPPPEKTAPKLVKPPDSASSVPPASEEKAVPPEIPLDASQKIPPPSPGSPIQNKLPPSSFLQLKLLNFLLVTLIALFAVLLFMLYRSNKNLENKLSQLGEAQKTLGNMNHEVMPSEGLAQEAPAPALTAPVTESLPPKEDAQEAPAATQSKLEDSTPPPSQSHEATISIVPTIRERPSSDSIAKKELERIRSEMASIFTKAVEQVASGELPLIGWGSSLPRVQKLAPEHENKRWFFIGDIHGDFLALHTLLNNIREVPDFRLAFLGDLVDRGTMGIECFALLLETAEKYPNQILWILGNHDIALKYLPKGSYRVSGELDSRKFISKVEPAEFVDWLNQKIASDPKSEALTWGRLFSQICERLPVAVLFQTGLLATHGGVPLRDRWPTLKNIEAFHHLRSLEDFTWTRATEYPKKVGFMSEHRAESSNFEFGYRDFEGFCQAVSQFFTVKQLVRGHDHVPGGFHKHPEYKINPVLTLNGFGFNYLSNSVLEYRPKLCVGVLNPGALLEVEEIAYAPEDYEALYKNNLE